MRINPNRNPGKSLMARVKLKIDGRGLDIVRIECGSKASLPPAEYLHPNVNLNNYFDCLLKIRT